MKKAYIAHPLRGARPYSEEQCIINKERINRICMTIAEKYRDITPVSPVHAFDFLDPLTCDQKLVMKYCCELLNSCGELWLFEGWRLSSGCPKELKSFSARNGQSRIVFCKFNEEERIIEEIEEIRLSDPECNRKLLEIIFPDGEHKDE